MMVAMRTLPFIIQFWVNQNIRSLSFLSQKQAAAQNQKWMQILAPQSKASQAQMPRPCCSPRWPPARMEYRV